MTARYQGGADSVVEYVLDTKLGDYAGLVIWDTELFRYFAALFWWQDLVGFYGPEI